MKNKFFCLVVSKRLLIAWGLFLLSVSVLSIYGSYPLAVLTTSMGNPEIKYDIMLDPGHGGVDSGGRGADALYEKDITLDVVLQVRDILEANGMTVGLTRDSDTDVSHLAEPGSSRHRRDLLARFQMMNTARMGLSVHVNSADDPSMHGAIVFYMRDSYLGQRFAQSLFDKIEPHQVMNHTFVVPRSNLWLLQARNPVALVELGFLTNESDYEKLADPQFLTNMAEAIAQGVLAFSQVRDAEQSE